MKKFISNILYWTMLVIHGRCYMEQKHVWYRFEREGYVSKEAICKRCGTIIINKKYNI